MTNTTFRPDAVEIEDPSLREVRGCAERIGVNRRRVYGLALEFAATNEDEFLVYAREKLDETQTGTADGTQQQP